MSSVNSLGIQRLTDNGEFVGNQLDFYTVRTLLDIRVSTAKSESQNRLNSLIQIIGLRTQPIILSVETVTIEIDPIDLPLAPYGEEIPVYTLKFAIEHHDAWQGATPTLTETMYGVAGFQEGNVAVIYHASL